MNPIPLPPSVDAVRAISAELGERVADDMSRVLLAADALGWARGQVGALRAAPTPTAVLELVVREARALTGAPEVWAVGWSGGPDGPVSFRALVGAGGEAVPPPEGVSRTVLGRVAASGRPEWSDDAGADARFAGARSVQGFALRSVGCVPLGARGALYLHDPAAAGRFDPRARARVTALCALAAEFLAPVPRRVARVGPAPEPLPGVVGESAAMLELVSAVRAFAPMPWPILVLGETGTGKERVARAIHALSPRGDAPFVAVNCGAIPDELAESTLFGHERGAFTGAERRREGLVERVRGGTLFLDEVGELSPRAQVKLLRLLQESTFARVGGEEELRFSGRIVAATHRPIDEDAGRDAFREDLFHRLSACVVRVPPLRERREDIPALVAHLVAAAARELPGAPTIRVDEALVEELSRRAWPGNVRELQNALRGALARCLAAGGAVLSVEHLGAGAPEAPPPLPEGDLLAATEAFQRQMVEAALAACGGHRTRAAERLGVSRQWLHRLLSRWEGAP